MPTLAQGYVVVVAVKQVTSSFDRILSRLPRGVTAIQQKLDAFFGCRFSDSRKERHRKHCAPVLTQNRTEDAPHNVQHNW